MLVLELLAKKSMYGYEMIQTLKGTSEDFFALKEGTLYPILYRLEDNDFAKSSWSEPKDGKAPKKYYEITKKGRERLLFQKEHWTLFEKKVDEILGAVEIVDSIVWFKVSSDVAVCGNKNNFIGSS